MCAYAAEAVRVAKGPLARGRETGVDAAKKRNVRRVLGICGGKE